MKNIYWFLFLLIVVSQSLHSALWENPVRESGGWKEIGWLGWIFETDSAWITHAEHGDLFVSGTDEESVWFFDNKLGWIWTGASIYPNLYHAGAGTWLFYSKGASATTPRYVFHYDVGDWARIDRLNPSAVTHSTEDWDWNHQNYTATPDLELVSINRGTTVRTFELTVIENDWIRVGLLPDWGGRILSIFYKPLEFEMLYYPRAGARSRIIEAPGTFYYDWILLAYGINPTFPSGEHGKYWGVPWPLELVEESDDKITFRMSQVDDDYRSNPNDVTNLLVNMDVSVFRDRFYLEVEYALTNQESRAVDYEFWTPAAFSPTRPSESAMPLDTEIIMNHDEVSLYDWWNWMDQKEIFLEADQFGINPFGVYTFDALRDLENWDNVGIAYAYPELEIPYFGALNHRDGFGAMRTADDPEAAPGMKIWGGGIDSFMWELWSGVTPQFFLTERLEANETRRWKEFYLPFSNLEGVSHATKFGVAEVVFTRADQSEETLLRLSGTTPGESWSVHVYPVIEGLVQAEPAGEFIVSFDGTGSTIERWQTFDRSNLADGVDGWHYVMNELFTGEERMRFSVMP
jgi:hypothetical protein